MIPIQFVLIAGVLLLAFEYFTRLRSRLWDRALVIGFAAVGIAFVAYPEYTTTLAHRLSVGRGTDLLFYVSLLGVGFILMLLFSSLRELQDKLTRLTREIALLSADETAAPDQAALDAARGR
jgi:hypothetical protein